MTATNKDLRYTHTVQLQLNLIHRR